MHFPTILAHRALSTSSLMMGLLMGCVPSNRWVESSFVVIMGISTIPTPLWSTPLPMVEALYIDIQCPLNHRRFVDEVCQISNFEWNHLVHDSWLQTLFRTFLPSNLP
jgi:hypothetical protein